MWFRTYRTCSRTLQPLDAGFLVTSIYLKDGGSDMVAEVFGGTPLADAHMVKLVDQGDNSSRIRWSRWEFEEAAVTVFAIRGTSNFFDAMVDLSYYSLVSSFKILSTVMPLAELLPHVLVINMVGVLTNEDFRPTEYLELLDEVRAARSARPPTTGHTTMVVGHSLGGSYANIVGSLARVPTFTFSPAGLYYGVKKFGLEEPADVYPFVSSLIPDKDPVPQADDQVGASQCIDDSCAAIVRSSATSHAAQTSQTWCGVACQAQRLLTAPVRFLRDAVPCSLHRAGWDDAEHALHCHDRRHP